MGNQLQTYSAAVPNGIAERLSRLDRKGLIKPDADKLRVYLASEGKKIGESQPYDIAVAMVQLQRQLGIAERNLSGKDMLNPIIAWIQDNYGRWGLSELVEATKLLFSEELTNQEGKTIQAKDHYQSFSLAFVSLWLNGYNRYRTKARRDARKLLPDTTERDISHEEVSQIKREFLEKVLFPCWESWRETKEVGEYSHALADIYSTLEEAGWGLSPGEKMKVWNNIEDEPTGAEFWDQISRVREGKNGAKKVRAKQKSAIIVFEKILEAGTSPIQILISQSHAK